MGMNEKSHIKVQSKRKPSWLERLKAYLFFSQRLYFFRKYENCTTGKYKGKLTSY